MKLRNAFKRQPVNNNKKRFERHVLAGYISCISYTFAVRCALQKKKTLVFNVDVARNQM